jgi:hypothetical protein
MRFGALIAVSWLILLGLIPSASAYSYRDLYRDRQEKILSETGIKIDCSIVFFGTKQQFSTCLAATEFAYDALLEMKKVHSPKIKYFKEIYINPDTAAPETYLDFRKPNCNGTVHFRSNDSDKLIRASLFNPPQDYRVIKTAIKRLGFVTPTVGCKEISYRDCLLGLSTLNRVLNQSSEIKGTIEDRIDYVEVGKYPITQFGKSRAPTLRVRFKRTVNAMKTEIETALAKLD